MFVDTAYKLFQWFGSAGGQAQAQTVIDTTINQATETITQTASTPILETAATTAAETVSASMLERLASQAASAWGWCASFIGGTWKFGNSVVSNGAGFVDNTLKMGSHGTQALSRFAQAGDLATTTFKNTLEYVDTIGIALYEGLLIISPKLLAELFQATELRLKQQDKDLERNHPVGWGIATLMTTAVSAYLLYSLASMMLRRTKNQNELSEITNELASMIKIQQNHSFLSLTLSTVKTLGISAMLFCGGAAVSLPLLVATPIAAVPLLTPLVKWAWSKHKGEAEINQLEEVVACAKRLQKIQEGIETARFKEQARAILLSQAQRGDPQALDRLYSIIDRATIVNDIAEPAKEATTSVKGRPPVMIYTTPKAVADVADAVADAKAVKVDSSLAAKAAVGKRVRTKH